MSNYSMGNILLNAWRIIRNSGSSFQLLIDGMMDGFKDDTGVASVTGGAYNSTNDLYAPTSAGGGLGDGLVAHYKMNDNAADTVVAENINGYTGTSQVNNTEDMTVAGVSTTTGTALTFDGAGDAILAADGSQWDVADDNFSYSMWVNTPLTNEWNPLLGTSWSSGGRTKLLMLHNGVVRFGYDYGDGSGTDLIEKEFDTTLTADTWTHLALVRNGATITVYINGVAEATTENIGTRTIFYNSSDLRIGWDFSTYSFDGAIDDIRIYNKALTTTEIAQIYGLGSGLVAHYKMNDDAASTDVVDSIGSYTGTAQQDTEDINDTGKINGCLTFNGSSDKITAADAIGTGGDKKFSVSFWYNADTIPDYASMLTLGGYNQDDGNDNGLTIGFWTDGQYYVDTYGTAYQITETTPTSAWVHIVLTADGTNFKFYKNGSLLDTTARNPTFITGPTVMGYGILTRYFDGKMDDVRIYNTTLSQGQVDALYNATDGTEDNNIGTEDDTGGSGADNMTIVSNAFTAEAAPSTARIIILEDDVDEITLNTDLIASVSRDGTNYTAITLSDEGAFDGTKRVLSGAATISTTSGTTMKWKLETANNKDLDIYGVGVLWK